MPRHARHAAAFALSCIACGAAGPGIASDTASLRLHDGFEAGAFDPAGGLYYKKNAEQAAGVVEFQRRDARRGEAALSLSVVTSCAPAAKNCSERAEVWERPAVLAGYDKALWYAFSMKLVDPVPADNHRYVMAQWKREILPGAEGDYSPFLALRLIRGELAMTVETGQTDAAPQVDGACPAGAARVNSHIDVAQTRALVATQAGGEVVRKGFGECAASMRVTARDGALPAANSGWIDFVFKVKPGPDGDGSIEIAANNVWIASVSGKVGHAGAGLGPNQYFKFGPYRAGHDGRWTVLYDDFKRGPDCADVADEALCRRIAGGRE